MSAEKQELNKKRRETHRQFFLSFFNGQGYEEKEMNGFWLVKHWDTDHSIWVVALYRNDEFKRYKGFAQTVEMRI